MTTTEAAPTNDERFKKRMIEQSERMAGIKQRLDFDSLIGRSIHIPDPYAWPRRPLAKRGAFQIGGAGAWAIHGLTQGGKSFFGVDFACNLSTDGVPWLGSGESDYRTVLYLQLEGEYEQVAERIVAWETQHGAETGDSLVHVRTDDFNWADKEVAYEVNDLADESGAEVIFIDTLDAGRRTGANMADDEVGRIFAQVLPTLTARRQVFVIAHSNAKDDSMAGLSRQVNAVEGVLHIKKRGDHRVVILEKNKDVPGHPEIEFDIVDSGFVTPIGPVGIIQPVSEGETVEMGAGAWLTDYLKARSGAAPSKDVKEAATAAGITERTLRSARERLVDIDEKAAGRTVWRLRSGVTGAS